MANEAITVIKTLPDKKIKGKSLKEILSYDNVSLWWFTEFFLFLRLKKILNKEKHKNKSFELFLSLFVRYYILAKSLLRYFWGRLIKLRHNTKKTENVPKVIAVSYSMNWRNASTPEVKKQKEDAMLGNIINERIGRNNEVIALDQDTSSFMGIKTLLEKAIYKKGLWKPVETYSTLTILKKVLRTHSEFRKEVKKLRRDGLQLLPLLEEDFLIAFRYHIFYAILFIELMKRAIDIENPDLILITCEYCMLGRAAVVAGKLKGVPTLAVQHGNISPHDIAYYHRTEEISDEIAPQYCPIPCKTTVYSPYDKELLLNIGHYPPDSVVVTGSSRYDLLNHADKIYDKNKIFEDLGLDANKKMIVWTTQTHGLPPDENMRNISAVYGSINSLEDVQLVIKLHPGEDQRATLYKKNKSIKPVVVGGKVDIYALLYACDLMITRHSTTATEAVILNKPVIVLNLSGKPDSVEYVKEGVALGAYNENDLKPAILKLLKNDADLAKSREKYIEKYLYKIDGKATERVISLIEEMIRER
ncbi:MAG: CDP-glycerol glycerophosphotransferase family protein [Candidatus Thermoplasmatota archaeon]|nr:CDP-glycerol glycerophosphotransferase family protein [Candidatus Thermoplasmatota archaeon]